MPQSNFPYRHALVTGASSGIGAALCRHLDRVGIEKITLVARRVEMLQKLAQDLKCATSIIQANLLDEADRKAVIEASGTVDLLVNNAGFGSFGPFADAPLNRQMDMITLNCQAPLHLTSNLLPQMIAERHGCIVNISSGTAFQPMPYMSTYAATKSFLLHWSEGLREELQGMGVRVIAVCPGTIDTEFATASDIPLHDIPAVSMVTGSMDSLTGAIISAITKDRGVIVPGLGNFIGSMSSRFTPRFVVRKALAFSLRPAVRLLSINKGSDSG